MKQSYYITADTIWSPIGETTNDALSNIISGICSIKKHKNKNIGHYLASTFDKNTYKLEDQMNFFEFGIVKTINRLIEQTSIDLSSDTTYIVIASTKGNIDGITTSIDPYFPLKDITTFIEKKYNCKNKPLIISNACISGIQAFGVAQFLLKTCQQSENILIVGGDLVSNFVLSGFYSFQALSTEPCKPFDLNRSGLTLGEGFAGLVLSKKNTNSSFKLLAVGSSNDANHISGPSRTGDGLALAISRAINRSKISKNQIDVICAHGTATRYNDEMESLALNTLSLTYKNIYGLKGFFGHTLGAAGIIESIIAMHLLKKQLVVKSIGYNTCGTSVPLNIITQNTSCTQNILLKTGAGFGGGNAALIIELN
jgi:3-oxoacyl-[acyl-carrier-protein] synthase-1